MSTVSVLTTRLAGIGLTLCKRIAAEWPRDNYLRRPHLLPAIVRITRPKKATEIETRKLNVDLYAAY
jgi:hypothetical protein